MKKYVSLLGVIVVMLLLSTSLIQSLTINEVKELLDGTSNELYNYEEIDVSDLSNEMVKDAEDCGINFEEKENVDIGILFYGSKVYIVYFVDGVLVAVTGPHSWLKVYMKKEIKEVLESGKFENLYPFFAEKDAADTLISDINKISDNSEIISIEVEVVPNITCFVYLKSSDRQEIIRNFGFDNGKLKKSEAKMIFPKGDDRDVSKIIGKEYDPETLTVSDMKKIVNHFMPEENIK